MEKKIPPARAGSRGRGFLAPAALATLLAGGGAAALGEPEGERAGQGARLAAGLPAILMAMSEIDRVGLIAGWAVSPSPRVRLAIARALRQAPPTCGSLTAIEHLAGDPDPLVRVAIAQAAWLRRREDPARLIGVLHRLADDAEPFVRDVAQLAVGDA